MEEYKPNSNRFKEQQKEKNVKSVVTGTTKTKKKSDARKLADIFLPDDVTSVKSYIIAEVVIPAIKRIITDTVDAVLYPGGSGRPKNSTTSRFSYDRCFGRPSERRDSAPSRSRTGLDYDEIVFDNRGDAEAVLTAMDDIIAQFGTVSVGDLYDLAQISTSNYAINKYGWTDLHTASVVRVRDGYMLKLPRALPID